MSTKQTDRSCMMNDGFSSQSLVVGCVSRLQAEDDSFISSTSNMISVVTNCTETSTVHKSKHQTNKATRLAVLRSLDCTARTQEDQTSKKEAKC
jgi:hypothetical protein